jgi:ubiquinone/menaquinone biosynthesis C-methylase UbiE
MTSAAYDPVAELYDRAFTDIRMRRDEWRWLERRFDALHSRALPRVLDIGCGNGALLSALANRIEGGVGVDVSTRFVSIAQARTRGLPHLSFAAITSSALPFDDHAFDVVISFLSFRYLHWDTAVPEMLRVLRPGGRVLIVDMVKQPARPADALHIARAAVGHVLRPMRDRRFHRDIARLTSHPDWLRMLARHPMRDAAEYRACFERWFPGQRIYDLHVTPRKRIIALDSGPLAR